MLAYLAQAKLEDVFKSTQENFRESPDGNRLLGVLLGAVAIVLLLVLFSQRRKRAAAPKPLNHKRKLLREVTRQLPIRTSEMRQLKALAQEQSCSSPLVLLLCPSLLAKGMTARTPKSSRRILGRVARKLGVG